MISTTKKILLCAYACEPNKGSEPGVGWDTSIHLSKQDSNSNYYVLTRENNKKVIEKESIPSNLRFIYYDLPSLLMYLKRKGNLVRIYYYLWMLGAVLKLWRKRNEFKIIHHLTFVNDWLPSLFVFLKTKNNFFIWGSIGSHNKIDTKFLNSAKEKIIEKCRILLQVFFRNFDVFFWMCKRKSDCIIGINDEVKNKIKLNKKSIEKFKVIPAIAISKNQLKEVDYENKTDKFKIISVGRLMYIKNFELALRSFSKFLELIPKEKRNQAEFVIIGKGKLKQELINSAKRLNIENNVSFKGQIPQKEVMINFNESDVFLFPTMESAGFVVLEAMTNYLPVIALEYGGPKQFVMENRNLQLTSIEGKIEEIEKQISLKILELYNNSELREEIGLINNKTVQNYFMWEHKTQSILKIYNSLLQKV